MAGSARGSGHGAGRYLRSSGAWRESLAERERQGAGEARTRRRRDYLESMTSWIWSMSFCTSSAVVQRPCPIVVLECTSCAPSTRSLRPSLALRQSRGQTAPLGGGITNLSVKGHLEVTGGAGVGCGRDFQVLAKLFDELLLQRDEVPVAHSHREAQLRDEDGAEQEGGSLLVPSSAAVLNV